MGIAFAAPAMTSFPAKPTKTAGAKKARAKGKKAEHQLVRSLLKRILFNEIF